MKRSRATAIPPPADCATVREALSAHADAEPVPASAPTWMVREHLGRCAACSRYATSLDDLDLRMRAAATGETPNLTSAILTTLAHDRPAALRLTTLQLRWLVALAGLVQLLLAVPVFAGIVGPDVHAGRDLGALQLALGVGLLFAAAQPRRAVGVVPVAAVVAAGTVVVAAIDVASGVASFTAELAHASELVGVGALWVLARRTPTTVVPAAADSR